MIEQYGKLIFIDLETTGPNPVIDRVTEIGIVEVTRTGVQRWSMLVNPQVPIPPFISGLTGITDEMVRNAPTFDMVQDELLQRLQDGLFIAHNARFDYGFLRNEFRRLGKTFRCEVLCTLKLSRKLFPDIISHGLDALVERHGLSTEARHRALGDAEVLWQYWQLLEKTVAGETIAAIARQLLQRPNLPAHLDPDMFDDLPDSPGVYVFYGENDAALFIARAPHLRQRVLTHFHGEQPSKRDIELAKEARRFEWFETAGEVGAQLLEARLIRQLQPSAAIGRPTEQDVCAWRIEEDESGVRPSLAFANEPGFARGSPCYGLFTSDQKAEMALRALAEKHGLSIGSRRLSRERLEKALASLPVVNWRHTGPIIIVEHGDNGREDMQLVQNWHWLGTAHSAEDILSLQEQALNHGQPSFEFDTYRILSRAIEQGKVEIRQLA
jgi:DNA polymerase III subunit epsilon